MFSIVGNSINSSNKKVLEKMNKMDLHFIEKEVLSQINEGAEFIKLDAQALPKHEYEFLRESVTIIEEKGGKALIKTRNMDILTRIIDFARNEIIIGDVEYDQKRIMPLIEIVREKENVKIIATATDGSSEEMQSPEHALLIAQYYVDFLLENGVHRDDILLEPIVRPLDTNYLNGRHFLNTLGLFKLDFPNIKTIANLSMLSVGLPKRSILSAHCAALSIEKGLDYAILNIMEKVIVESIICTLTIIGKDRNMKAYQNFCKQNKFIKN